MICTEKEVLACMSVICDITSKFKSALWPTTARVAPVLRMFAIFVVSALGVFFLFLNKLYMS